MKIVFLIIILLSLFLIYKPFANEHFDLYGLEYVPLGYNRFGLRGDLLNTHPIDDCYYDKYNCYFSTFGGQS